MTSEQQTRSKADPKTLDTDDIAPLSNPASTSIRQHFGRELVQLQQSIDAHLWAVRSGCIAVMVGSAAAIVRLSGVLQRFNHINDIPSYYYKQRKTLSVRMIRQNKDNPNIFYVYHVPWLRRILLQDRLPPEINKMPPFLPIRAFGVQVDESAHDWLEKNAISNHQYMKIELLHKVTVDDDIDDAVVTCNMALRKFPFNKDLALELVSRGLAECITETMANYETDGTQHAVVPLMRRLERLEIIQKRAQSMQYGIWFDWTESDWKKRVLNAGKRATSKGVRRLVKRITCSNS